MSTIVAHRPASLRTSCHGIRYHCNFQIFSASWKMTSNYRSSQKRKKDELSMELQKLPAPQLETSTPSNLRFDRLQEVDQEFIQENRFEFGQFVAREAILDEEYWTAAWLRAESHWEDRRSERYIDNHKRKFADQEFNALKRRCKAQIGQKCTCIVTVKKEETNVKRTVVKSVVGTLDLSIGHLLHGETFPGEQVKASLFCHISRSPNKYGYISNLCVAKSARRQGIASNMLQFAVRSAKLNGAEQVFMHVHRDNRAAQELYQKMGFKVVDVESRELSANPTYLLRMKA